MTNPFKNIWEKILDEEDLKNEIIPAIGITFEGPLMHRSMIEKIGFPEKKFFIYGDDTEYFIRAWKADYEIAVIRDARFDRKLNFANPLENINWKFYYVVRNIVAIDVLQGSAAVRFIRPFGYFIKWMKHTKNIKEFGILLKGFIHGYFYRSEN
ncbi:MAG: hypothetical protein PF588_01690 [Candidatus Kapabacteria bacterium]|nr:hypothetical protein [Candidatus Kapabacteria bacterium]